MASTGLSVDGGAKSGVQPSFDEVKLAAASGKGNVVVLYKVQFLFVNLPAFYCFWLTVYLPSHCIAGSAC